MPHLTLEYSANVTVESDLASLFHRLHEALVQTGGIRLENCKSRAYPARDFLVGSGSEGSAFVHLDIRFLEGRPAEVRQSIGQEARDILVEWFQFSVDTLDLQVTVEVRDIERALYFKFPEGTLSA